MGKTRDSANLVSHSNILVDITNDRVGVGTETPTSKLHVAGNSLITGISTLSTLSSTVGTITNLTGTAATITTLNATSNTTTNQTITNLTGTAATISTLNVSSSINSVSGVITSLTGTATTFSVGNFQSNLYSPVGLITNLSGTNLNYTGGGNITNLTGTSGTITNFIPTNINSSGVSTLTTINTTNLVPTNINSSGVSTLTTINTIYLVPTNINSSGIITSARLGINTTSVTQQFQVGSGTTIVVIDSVGEVGIATTNPTSKLHVAGDALITGISTLTTAVVGSAVTINATGVNASGVTGIITAKDFRIANVAEKLTIQSGNTVTISYGSSSNVVLASNPSGDITVNVANIPTTTEFNESILTFSVIVSNTGTARSCTAVNLNGVSRTIQWFGGSLASAVSGVTTIRGYDLYSFTGINTVGSASTTTNYVVLGNVNGSYR